MNTNGKICNNCQYFRDPAVMKPATLDTDGWWCSNSKSPHSMTVVAATDSCEAFSKKGKKAPLGMRLGIKAARKVKGKTK